MSFFASSLIVSFDCVKSWKIRSIFNRSADISSLVQMISGEKQGKKVEIFIRKLDCDRSYHLCYIL